MVYESPAVILYDANGNPIAVRDGYAPADAQKGIISAGITDENIVKFIAIEAGGELKTVEVGTTSYEKKNFDIQDTQIFIGAAGHSVLDSETGWTIIKYTLVDGLVVSKRNTLEKEAVWDNRELEFYY